MFRANEFRVKDKGWIDSTYPFLRNFVPVGISEFKFSVQEFDRLVFFKFSACTRNSAGIANSTSIYYLDFVGGDVLKQAPHEESQMGTVVGDLVAVTLDSNRSKGVGLLGIKYILIVSFSMVTGYEMELWDCEGCNLGMVLDQEFHNARKLCRHLRWSPPK